MATNTGLTVHGLRELQQAFKAAGPAAKKELTGTLREVAEPIRADAEQLASTQIRRIGRRWDRMRTGVTQRVVYVAPRQRGVRRAGDPRARPKFARLMEARAMTPALNHNKPLLERRVDATFAELARRWNRS